MNLWAVALSECFEIKNQYSYQGQDESHIPVDLERLPYTNATYEFLIGKFRQSV